MYVNRKARSGEATGIDVASFFSGFVGGKVAHRQSVINISERADFDVRSARIQKRMIVPRKGTIIRFFRCFVAFLMLFVKVGPKFFRNSQVIYTEEILLNAQIRELLLVFCRIILVAPRKIYLGCYP